MRTVDSTDGVQAIPLTDTLKPLSLSVVAGAGVLTGLWMIQAGWKVVLAAPLVSGGFFGIAHTRALRALLYTGALLLVASTLTVGIGLIARS